MHGEEFAAFTMVVASGTYVITYLTRAYLRRFEITHQVKGIPAELDERLACIESAVDAIAVEVERVSEGQRFTTRLLTERGGAGGAADAPVSPPAGHAVVPRP